MMDAIFVIGLAAIAALFPLWVIFLSKFWIVLKIVAGAVLVCEILFLTFLATSSGSPGS